MQGGAKIYAVIDTNVVVSSLFSTDGTSHPAIVIQAILDGAIIPLYNEDILTEYQEVLSRPKFPFSAARVDTIISAFRDFGLDTQRTEVTDVHFPDPDDIVFYEVKMSVDDAFLVTGNIRHFPRTPFVVTPTEMVEILKKRGLVI